VQSFLTFGTGCRCAVGVSMLPYTGRESVLSVVGLNVVAERKSLPFHHELIADCPAMFM